MTNVDRLRARVTLADALDRLAVAIYDLEHPSDAERKGRRRRFKEAVLALPPGGVDAAWDDDLLTVEKWHHACQLRREAGLPL